jgi:hypothetical protein
MSAYKFTDMVIGSKVRVKGEPEYGVIFELLPKSNEVAVRYDDGNEYDVAVTTIDSVIAAAETNAAPPKSAETTQYKPTAWDGTGRPPVGAVVELVGESVKPRFKNTAWKVIKNNPKRVQVQNEAGLVLNAGPGFLKPTTLPFFENAAAADSFRTGSLVTYAMSRKFGMEQGRLWVVLGATKGSSTEWNIAPLNPPLDFKYQYVRASSTQLTFRKFSGLVIPV